MIREPILDRFQSDGGLNRQEAGTVIVELHDHEDFSFSDIAACFPRDRQWVEARYEEHPRGDGA